MKSWVPAKKRQRRAKARDHSQSTTECTEVAEEEVAVVNGGKVWEEGDDMDADAEDAEDEEEEAKAWCPTPG